jgi:uncharacterized membrane protein
VTPLHAAIVHLPLGLAVIMPLVALLVGVATGHAGGELVYLGGAGAAWADGAPADSDDAHEGEHE